MIEFWPVGCEEKSSRRLLGKILFCFVSDIKTNRKRKSSYLLSVDTYLSWYHVWKSSSDLKGGQPEDKPMDWKWQEVKTEDVGSCFMSFSPWVDQSRDWPISIILIIWNNTFSFLFKLIRPGISVTYVKSILTDILLTQKWRNRLEEEGLWRGLYFLNVDFDNLLWPVGSL